MNPHGHKRVVGRYAIYNEIASGGMATVHFGRLLGPVGFARTVAIKRLHPHLATSPEFVAMFLDEARLAARIRHPNVVPTVDVVTAQGELLLVMEYVPGESLSKLIHASRNSGGVPPPIASAIAIGMLEGLHAAHEAQSDRGGPLGIVHRDVSPQNVILGEDGNAHVFDFGVAKAVGRLQQTGDGEVKGKFAYMSPEQLAGHEIDRRTDVYAASVVLWQTLTGRKLFDGDSPAAVVQAVLTHPVHPPSAYAPHVPRSLDAVVMRGLARTAHERFSTAREMALAIEDAVPPATPRRVQEWLASMVGNVLAARARNVAEIEVDSAVTTSPADDRRSAAALFAEMSFGAAPGAAQPWVGAPTPPGGAPAAGQGPVRSGTDHSVSAVANNAASLRAGRSSSMAWLGVVGAILILSVAGVAFEFSRRGRAPATAPSAAMTVSGTPNDGLRQAPEPTTTAGPTPMASASVTVSAASAAPSASSNASSPPVLVPPVPVRPQVVPVQRQPSNADCSNPFTIDANGHKRPRPECF